ncbi:hypothetical protein JB92DRAFT_3102777 [Gautieria morchelliformis]|nr:hypothetical protein JB92DRAFT_3102777 [Gautieria morchelliformis]
MAYRETTNLIFLFNKTDYGTGQDKVETGTGSKEGIVSVREVQVFLGVALFFLFKAGNAPGGAKNTSVLGSSRTIAMKVLGLDDDGRDTRGRHGEHPNGGGIVLGEHDGVADEVGVEEQGGKCSDWTTMLGIQGGGMVSTLTVEELSSENMDGVADEVGEDEQGRMSELLLINAEVPGALLTMGVSESGVARNIRPAHCVANVAVAGRGGWLDPTHCCSGESDVATHTEPDSIGNMSRDSDVAGHTRLTAGLCCERRLVDCTSVNAVERQTSHGSIRVINHLAWGDIRRELETLTVGRGASNDLQHFNSTVKKRLHVPGLTPAITATDISARLQGFGKVPLGGVGALNAVGPIAGAGTAGETRKFAYVTLEATDPI